MKDGENQAETVAHKGQKKLSRIIKLPKEETLGESVQRYFW